MIQIYGIRQLQGHQSHLQKILHHSSQKIHHTFIVIFRRKFCITFDTADIIDEPPETKL
jgi:hypothetical protein